MKTEEIINLLQSIDSTDSGTNFTLRFNNKIMINKIDSFQHTFFDQRMASFYYNILKNVPNTECTLAENKIIESKNLARIVQKENKEGVIENVIQYYSVPYKERWCWILRFTSTIEMIIEGNK